MGVTGTLRYQAGWQTKIAPPRQQAAECLPGENEGCLGSRSLGEAKAKATQGSWPLPDHDSASPVPRVTCPLPQPWGWWPGELKLLALWPQIIWLGWWLILWRKTQDLLYLRSSCIELDSTQIHICPNPIIHPFPKSPPKNRKNKKAASDIQKLAWHSQLN